MFEPVGKLEFVSRMKWNQLFFNRQFAGLSSHCNSSPSCTDCTNHTDSHPKFKRNDLTGVSSIKRVPKKKSKKAAAKRADASNHSSESANNNPSMMRPTAFNGEQMVSFPSLLDGIRREDTRGNETVFGQIYDTVTSQVADRARYLLVRLPPSSQVAGIFDKESEASMNTITPTRSSSNNAYASLEPNSSIIASSSGQENGRKPISPNRSLILGSGRVRSPSTLVQDYGIQLSPCDFDVIAEDDLEPIAWSPPQEKTRVLSSEPAHNPFLPVSLEPRRIEEMRANPDNLNRWYRYLPIIPTPRLQAQLEYSSPLSLSAACYFLDISTFGMWWSFIFTVGHTVQSMLTSYGPNTESFTLSPEIGIVPHHFMDMMWMHSHFSCLVLLPDLFGPSSMTLFNYFVMTQALNLSIGIKTNYHHIEVKRGVWRPGRWWLADIVRWIFLGYLGSFFTISIGNSYGNDNLKVIGVFTLNLTVLWVWESYRLLLSTRGKVERQLAGDKKST